MYRYLVVTLSVVLVGCAGGKDKNQTAVDRQSFLAHFADDVILPAYEAAQLSAEGFTNAVSAFCAAPTTAGLAATRLAWQSSHVDWEKTAVHAFGPVVDLRYGNKIDFWPYRADKIEEFFAANAVITADLLEDKGSLVRGFAVAEYLLFGTEVKSVNDEPERCAYLEAVASVLYEDIRAVVKEWDSAGSNFVEQFKTAGKGSSAYPKQQQALDALLNQMIAAVQNWESMKLAKPIGRQDGGAPQPAKVESPDAKVSKELLIANLQGFRQAFSGDVERSSNSLAAILAVDDPDLATKVEVNSAELIAFLQDMPTSLHEAVSTDAEKPGAVFVKLKELLQWLAVDVAGKLGVTPTFSDNDGD